jgi:hypothetical protein
MDMDIKKTRHNKGCSTWRLPAGFGGGLLRNRSCRRTRTLSEIRPDNMYLPLAVILKTNDRTRTYE